MQKSRKQLLQEKFTEGFFGFWVRQYRISYLLVIALIMMGAVALMAIPKESSPSIKLGMIMISTAYPGVNPVDIDTLVSDKIYKEVKNIKGIDKIQSSSSLGFSNVTITLKTSANVKDVLSEVRNNVNRVLLPSDAKTPVVTEIETNTNQVFSLYLYSKDATLSKSVLFDRAQELKDSIEKLSTIDSVDLSVSGDGGPVGGGGGNDGSYDVEIVFTDAKLVSLGLTLGDIANTIRSSNIDQPIGNFAIGEQKYDFRIAGKHISSLGFLDISMALPKGGSARLGDLATIERVYKNEAVRMVLPGTQSGAYQYVGLTVNKSDSASIFSSSKQAKTTIDEVLKKKDFESFSYVYALDIADTIIDDYKDLAHEAMITIILVFVVMYLFVGFKDSLFATITLPLAFLATFIILYKFGYTLNFLTNFSLILSFGIAIDTIIVIVQGASAKLRVGYEPRTAIMLALREYAIPIISGVMTTIVVFIPMMTLPGIMGKFLAYIPVTIFGVLASGLFLALTVNSALYLLFVKPKKSYVDDPHAIEYATDEEKELLELEREGKEKIRGASAPLRIRIIHNVTESYKNILRKFLVNKLLRRLSIFAPVVFLVFSFIALAPRVGFELFPGDDNNYFSIVITGETGIKTEVMAEKVKGIESSLQGFPEMEYSSITTNGNVTNISVQLSKRKIRKELGQRSVFDIEEIVLGKLKTYEAKGLRVESMVLESGPPASKAVGVKLVAESAELLDGLNVVANDFETFLKTVPGTKNVGKSSKDTPGQMIFTLKEELLAEYRIPSSLVMNTITTNMNGIRVGSIEDDGNDMDIIIRNGNFRKDVSVTDILSLPLTVGPNTYSIGTFVESTLQNATASVSREDGDIQIGVESDLEEGVDTLSTQNKLITFAENYSYPAGISFKSGGENEENAELIMAVLSAFFISILTIFAILTLQFNSFSQPAVILYSVITALPFVMIGLLLTDNKFSMPFGIGFIAFTGIAVNHGIILIDAINQNLAKGMNGFTALVEAGSSRLEPMVLTTLTTALGILPIALRDKFWAGMGFTIIFGIIAASALTLFVVKGIYYEIYINSDEGAMKRFFRYTKSKLRRKNRVTETQS